MFFALILPVRSSSAKPVGASLIRASYRMIEKPDFLFAVALVWRVDRVVGASLRLP